MEIAGYVASIIIGISLGLIGGGGSILTVPVLVYLFSVDAVLATAYSLFIVGLTSAVGSIGYFRNGLVNIKTAIFFGIPSIVAVFLTRAYLVPAIPKVLFTVGGLEITKSIFILLMFAVLMVAASYSMIKPCKKCEEAERKRTLNPDQPVQLNYLSVLLEGTVVGTLTGLVGAGGGFLIIPALVLFSKLPIKEAVGTSLAIIAAKSLIGFMGESSETAVDWTFLTMISAFAIVGIFIGSSLSKRIDGGKLKPAFGWFTLVMGIYMILKETVLATHI